jgi:hypothetical protein
MASVMINSERTNIYLVRQILLADDYGSIRIDEEAAFPSFEEANSFLQSLVDPDADEGDLLSFRNEIIELPLGEVESWKHMRRWTFSIDGRLMQKYPDPELELSDFERFTCENKYEIGDIVFIKPKLHDSNSPSVSGDFAVIYSVPVAKQHWVEDGREPSEWDGAYIVCYITDTGILNHKHVPESALMAIPRELPEELKFLEIYSNHLQNKELLPKEVIESVLENRVFVRKTKVFDFKSE